MNNEYLNLFLKPYKFDCINLVSLYLKKELNIENNLDKYPRYYRDEELIRAKGSNLRLEYAKQCFIEDGFIEINSSDYIKGDIVISNYKNYVFCSSICINENEALTFTIGGLNTSKTVIKPINEIENKVYHFRHNSLV